MARAAGRGPSLVRRLVLLAAAWSLAVLVGAGVSLSLFFNHAATVRFDDELSETIDGLLAGATFENGQVSSPPPSDPMEQRAYSGEYWEIAVADGSGAIHALARSRSLWDRALPAPPQGLAALAAAQGKPLYYNAAGPLEKRLRIAASEVRVSAFPTPVIFLAGQDRTPLDRDLRTFITTIAAALGILGFGLIAAVIVQVRVGLQPLFALRREVAEVRTGKREKLERAYPIELSPLASELNALVAHNQQVVERQRTHVGNLAHALKTPLSVILTEAGQRGGDLGALVERQAKIMSQQVDHHLRRARAAARTEGFGERTQVVPVLEELARALERLFRDRIAGIDLDCPEGLAFHGERQDLLEIAGNVMENACKWAKSRVRVSAASRGPDSFALTVEDDGEGLQEDQRETVMRRGARLDETSPGSGLGLSIVDELARAYDGSVSLGQSTLGGLKVEIRLPRAEF
jgi:signal transduction histidine kinase